MSEGEGASGAGGSRAASDACGAPGASRRTYALALVAAVVAAAAVRIPFLAEGLWYDEIAAFLGYSLRGPWGAVGTYFTQANHVLHSLLAWGSTTVLGVDEVSVRLPALLAGLGAVAAIGALAREAGGTRMGAVAAGLAAFMPTAVLPSTEARGYSLMVLFAALMTAALLRLLRGPSRGAWILYVAACGLGAWSHLVTVCVPAFHGLWCAWAWMRSGRDGAAGDLRRGARAGMAAVAAGAALTAILYAPIVPAMFAIRGRFQALGGNEPRILGPEGSMMLLALGGSWTWWASCAALPFAAAGVLAAREQAALRRALLLALGGAPVALAFPVFLNSWLYARFLGFTVPGIALLLAAGACRVHARRPAVAWALAAATVAAWLGSLAVLGPRQQIREAVKWVVDHRAEGEQAFAVGLPDDVHRWYSTLYGIEMPGSGPYGAELDARLRERPYSWAVLLYPRAMPQAAERLRAAGFAEDARFPGWIDQGGGEIVVFRRR